MDPGEDEDSRRWSERRFRSLVEATATEVFSTAPDGRLLSPLPVWQRLTGQSDEEMQGFGWLAAVHPDDVASVERTWRGAVAAGSVFDAQYRLARAGGGWAHVWVRAAPLRDDAGDVVEYVGLYHDITERVEKARRTAALEAALDRETQILERVVEQSPVGLALVWGPEHHFRLVNRSFEAIVPPDRLLVGRTVAEAMPEARELIVLLDRARAGKTVELGETAVAFGGPDALDGHRYYRAVYTPLPEADGSPGGVLATAFEITSDVRRRRGLERELARERRVAEILQRSLMPEALPEVAGVELCARYEPAGDESFVGGDWYDVFDAGDGRVVVAVGDVAGRGLQAATVMAQLRAGLRAYAIDDPSPAAVLTRMDELADRLERSATLAYGVLCPAEGTLQQGLAGHPPPLLVEPGGAALWLDDGLGTPLGAPAARRDTALVHVPHGAALVYYTDGLLAERELGITAGLEQLREAAMRLSREGDLASACERLLAESGGPEDDRALLVLRRV